MMKNYLKILITLFLALNLNSFAQRMNMNDDERPKRLEQFERMKLLEVLNMEEEIAVKFFTRRKEYKENLRLVHKKIEDVSKKLEDLIDDSKNQKDEIQKQIDFYYSYEQQILKLRQDFKDSVRELLTDEQIAKYVIFEIRFPREIQKLLFENRKGMRP